MRALCRATYESCASPARQSIICQECSNHHRFLVPSRSFDTTTTTICCFRLDTHNYNHLFCWRRFLSHLFLCTYPSAFSSPLPTHLHNNCTVSASTVSRTTTSPRSLRNRAVRRLTMTSTSNTPFATPATSTPNSRPGTPNLSTPPTSAAADNQLQDDSSKLRTFLGLLRKYVIYFLHFSEPGSTILHFLQSSPRYTPIGQTGLTVPLSADSLASQISQMFDFLCLLN